MTAKAMLLAGVLVLVWMLPANGHDRDQHQPPRDGRNEWNGERHHRGESFYVPQLGGYYACVNPFDPRYYIYCQD